MFYSSIRLEVRKIETIAKGTDDATGNLVRVKVLKNKVAPPYRKVEMEIEFGKGISAVGSLLDAAIKFDLVQKSGSWYSRGEERIGQGRENAKEFLTANADIAIEVEKEIRTILFPSHAEIKAADAATSDAVTGGEAGKEPL